MTEQIKAAGLTVSSFLEKNLAAVVSVVFAFGFVWAQFDGLRTQLGETRAQLKQLAEQYAADRTVVLADRRDMQRLLADASVQRERIIELRVLIQAMEGRVAKLEAIGRER